MTKAGHVNYIRTGPRGNAPVVLLHSAGLDLTYWDAHIWELSRRHDVIAVDLPGHGLSVATADTITTAAMARAVADAIASLSCGPVNLVGLSVGGLIAQEIAITDPRLVHSLALLDTAARFGQAGRTAMKQRAETVRQHGIEAILGALFGHWFLPETCEQRPDLVDRATKTLLHDDAAVHAALWETIADFDAFDRLGSIKVPALILVGRHDATSPIASSEELQGAIPDAQLHVIDNAAHLSPIEQPQDVTRHLAAFLQSVSSAETR